MPRQYLRGLTLSVDDGAKVFDYGSEPGGAGFRVRFWTQQFVSGTPANIRIWITNLSKNTAQKFLNKEYKKLTLSAGYDGSEGIVFRGQIVFSRFFREDITDTVLELIATSGETARNYAVVNKALAAGHSHDDRVQAALEAFKKFDIKAGHIDKLGGPKFPRNFVFSGMAHDLLREICTARQARWFIHSDRVNVLKNEKTLPGTGAIVLNSSTGLVGLAEQTFEGVQFNCLLNLSIIPGCQVQINESSVTRATYDPSYAAADRNALLAEGGLLGVAADGKYKILKVAHEGDTRGNVWYTHGVGVQLGADSPSLRAIGISDDFSR